MCSLDTKNDKVFPIFFYDATEISNMAAGGHSNMATFGNNKSILHVKRKVTFKVIEGKYWLHFKPISEA